MRKIQVLGQISGRGAFLLLAGLTLGALAFGVQARLDPFSRSTTTPIEMACSSCHAFSSALSHPVGVFARAVPGLPLAKGGTVVCTTCHTDASALGEHFAGGGAGASLRLPAERLCSACHAPANSPASALAHGLMLGRAHLDSGMTAELSAGALDHESRSCLGCHDGSAAVSAKVRVSSTAPNSRPLSSGWDSEHPIGVRYQSFDAPRKTPQFRPASSLPDAVRLFDGRIGCGSCHSAYSGVEGMGALPARRGGLCLSCHIK